MQTDKMTIGKKYIVTTFQRRVVVAEVLQLGLRGPGCINRGYCEIKVLHTTSLNLRGQVISVPVRNVIREFDSERDAYLLEAEARRIEVDEARKILVESARSTVDRLGLDVYVSANSFRKSVGLQLGFFDLDTARQFVKILDSLSPD